MLSFVSSRVGVGHTHFYSLPFFGGDVYIADSHPVVHKISDAAFRSRSEEVFSTKWASDM